jgi:hypothetical protein
MPVSVNHSIVIIGEYYAMEDLFAERIVRFSRSHRRETSVRFI